jgi:hypothetical protein
MANRIPRAKRDLYGLESKPRWDVQIRPSATVERADIRRSAMLKLLAAVIDLGRCCQGGVSRDSIRPLARPGLPQ